MHWSPEHAQPLNQWPEQHLDVSSTTSSPAHKSELYPSTRQRFNYAWATDDISALTASNLLKRYAEKYSGVLDAPYERPALSGYGDGAFGPVNGQKGDGEPWPGGHGSDASTGVRRPPRTLLLFGPRGTGKTLLSRCISTQLGSTLLKLSGTTLLSTWKAEAEKILQTVFFVASCWQPAVVLITEAESLLVARAGEDGSQVSNLKRSCTPPPDSVARRQILHHALAQRSSCLSEREMASLVQHTESFSGSELLQLCQHAGTTTTLHALPGQIQPTSYQDFEKAFCKVRPATSQKELDLFLEWDKLGGRSDNTVAANVGVHTMNRIAELLTPSECRRLRERLVEPELDPERLERPELDQGEQKLGQISEIDPPLQPRDLSDSVSCSEALRVWLGTAGEVTTWDRLIRDLHHIGRSDIALELGKNLNQDRSLELQKNVEEYKHSLQHSTSSLLLEDDGHSGTRGRRAVAGDPGELYFERRPPPPYTRSLLGWVPPLAWGILGGFLASLLFTMITVYSCHWTLGWDVAPTGASSRSCWRENGTQ
ncbi:PREDICTED: putative fidgetin-like protein 2 [Chaetura pelagica]|uniref:putative fidgetin-like protein 2 n=1 Tax=Chaetura pelagica TaxID=8897 RepID=UPI000523937F|nr:PREDICTED: putative fidgetin-like protein 2 [Chaetura pelagica]